MEISLISTSNDSAQGEDIILRETTTTRLLFRPMITNNIHNNDASVKGWFLFQRKKPGDLWEDYQEYNANNLKADEFFKLEIKSREMLELMNELDMYYKIHKEYGIQWGQNTFSKKDIYLEKVFEIFRDDDYVIDILMNDEKSELLQKTIKWIGNTENSDEIISKLLDTRGEELDHINNVIGLANLKRLLTVWEENSDNNSENFWQKTLG